MTKVGVLFKALPFVFLLLWPFSLIAVFILSVFMLDGSNVTSFSDFLLHYILLSSFVYPLYYLVTWWLRRFATRKEMSVPVLRAILVIPFLNGMPWLFIYLVFVFGLGLTWNLP
jgi:hypothetical protein